MRTKYRFIVATLLLLACLAFLTMPAVAQNYAPVTVHGQMVGDIPLPGSAATNTTTAAVIDCRRQQNVMFQFTWAQTAAATDNLTLAFLPSVDGVTYQKTTKPIALVIPQIAVGTNTIVTNLNVLGAGYLKLAYITNAGAAGSSITNWTLKYSIKPNAP